MSADFTVFDFVEVDATQHVVDELVGAMDAMMKAGDWDTLDTLVGDLIPDFYSPEISLAVLMTTRKVREHLPSWVPTALAFDCWMELKAYPDRETIHRMLWQLPTGIY